MRDSSVYWSGILKSSLFSAFLYHLRNIRYLLLNDFQNSKLRNIIKNIIYNYSYLNDYHRYEILKYIRLSFY